MATREGRKMIGLDIPTQMYEDIKLCSKNRNITMTKWIIRAFNEKLKDERVLEKEEPIFE